MVELCELKLMNKCMEDYWPPDIDQHVAQLDFDNSSSMLIDQSQLFESSCAEDLTTADDDDDGDAATRAAAAAEASVEISTDSLDMDLIRGETANKNDYKLTFEDSGQWTTTSGIGVSFTTNSNNTSPPTRARVYHHYHQSRQQHLQRRMNDSTRRDADCLAKTDDTAGANNYTTVVANHDIIGNGLLNRHFGLRLLEQLNNDEWSEAIGVADDEEKRKLIDNLLNNVATTTGSRRTDSVEQPERIAPTALTTWGRIRSAEPFDETTYSMPPPSTTTNPPVAVNDSRRPFSCGAAETTNADFTFGIPMPPSQMLDRRNDTNSHGDRNFNCCKYDGSRCDDDCQADSSGYGGNEGRTSRVKGSSSCGGGSTTTSCESSGSNSEHRLRSTSKPQQQRGRQLLANFVERSSSAAQRSQAEEQQQPVDYTYREVYMGAGRYVDVNENEIGYVPPSTASIQRSGGDAIADGRPPFRFTSATNTHRRSAARVRMADQPHINELTTELSCYDNNILSTTSSEQNTKKKGTMIRRLRDELKSADSAAVSHNGGVFPNSFTVPDLKFLNLSHNVPSLCRSTLTLDEMLRRARNGSLQLADCLADERLAALDLITLQPSSTGGNFWSENVGGGGGAGGVLSHPDDYCHRKASTNAQPDSGLGSSSSSGPAHIEDWPSLSVLLPRHVVDACSFFKTNSSLLTGSHNSSSNSNNNGTVDTSSASTTTNNNIERKRTSSRGVNTASILFSTDDEGGVACCRTCFGVRRRRLHPPAFSVRHGASGLCDCGTACCCCCGGGGASAAVSTAYSDVAAPPIDARAAAAQCRRLTDSAPSFSGVCQTSRSKMTNGQLLTRLPRLNAAELSVVGQPIYNSKRALVERVVEGVAEIARGASAVVLWSALECLLADGLTDERTPWQVIVEVTGPGPATNQIFQLVKSLEASEKPENSRIDHFFKEVLSLHSLEGWLSYVVLKENVLSRLYDDTAFLLRANSAYRSLFWRLIESIELLSVLAQCHRRNLQKRQKTNQQLRHESGTAMDASADGGDAEPDWGSASRLPSDSRIPKSSSVPSKLVAPTPSHAIAATAAAPPAVLVDQPEPSWVEEPRRPSILEAAISNAATANIDAVTQSEQSGCSATTSASVSTTATLPRCHRRQPSRIPVASCSPSTSRSVSRLRVSNSSSLISKESTPLVARAREAVAVNENYAKMGAGWLPLEAGEPVRVLSVRGNVARCCRLVEKNGGNASSVPLAQGRLRMMNGTVPTRQLDLC